MTVDESDRVYVLGAGHAGCVTALTLVEAGIPVTLVDRESAVSQGPACHLHAFGGIYPEMPDLESLPEHAIEFGLNFPQAVDLRPTVVVLAPNAPWSPSAWHERLRQGSATYEALLDKLEPSQRRFLIPDGAAMLEVLRTSADAQPKTFSPWARQAHSWLPDDARDAVLIWEVGINCIRLAGLLEQSLSRAGHLLELRLGTSVTAMTPLSPTSDSADPGTERATQRWRIDLQSADGSATSAIASAVVDARGARSSSDAPAEYKCVFWAEHPTGPNEPEVVVLDRRGGPGLTQYTPGAFGSRLHKMIQGASLFGAVSPGAPADAFAAALRRQSHCPLRCLATYDLARSILRPGTIPPPAAVRPLPTVARFQRLPPSGSAEARTSSATERRPGLIDVLLSKTVSAPAVALSVLALLEAGATTDRQRCGGGGRRLRMPASMTEEEVREAAEAVCVQRGLPFRAAAKYDWTITAADASSQPEGQPRAASVRQAATQVPSAIAAGSASVVKANAPANRAICPAA